MKISANAVRGIWFPWRFRGCDNPSGFNLFPKPDSQIVLRSLIPATRGWSLCSSQPLAHRATFAVIALGER
jgi:hypothetical protein